MTGRELDKLASALADARPPPGEVWPGAWRVHMMSGGVPTAQHYTNGLASACAYVKDRGLRAA